jgi:hypothetical protein
MAQEAFGVVFTFLLSLVLSTAVCHGQQPGAEDCPSQPPGVYLKGAGGWTALASATPSRMKAKHAMLSSLTEGAVAAPMIVEYAEPHAAVEVQSARPTVCVSHLMTSAPPLLVRLEIKKKTRELDSGSVRATPFVASSEQGHAQDSIIVPSSTTKPEYGILLLQPQTNLEPGQYAVMFGASNLAIFDFGVDAAATAQK